MGADAGGASGGDNPLAGLMNNPQMKEMFGGVVG